MDGGLPIEATAVGVTVRVKVAAGSSRSEVTGLLGQEWLKVAVTAPPEGGKANKAVCNLLAEVFGVARGHVRVANGHTRPQKTIEITGLHLTDATERLREHRN